MKNESSFIRSSSSTKQVKWLIDENKVKAHNKKRAAFLEETVSKNKLLVKDLLERLKNETLKEVANELGIKSSILSKKLRELGYTYNRSKKNYVWSAEGKEPLTQDLLSMIRKK